MRRHGTIRWAAAIAVVALILGACGGDAVETANSLEVTASDFEFSPERYQVPAGTEVSFTFVNDGAVLHEWAIMSSPIEDEGDFSKDRVLFELEARPGETATATIPPLDAGSYQVVCGVQGHYAAGMEAELEVVAGG